MENTIKIAMPCLRRSVFGFSPWKFGFNSSPVHVGFIVGEVAEGQFVRSISAFPSQHHSTDPPYLGIYRFLLVFNLSESVFKQRT